MPCATSGSSTTASGYAIQGSLSWRGEIDRVSLSASKFTIEGMKRLRSLGSLRSLKAFSPALPDGQLDLEGADLQAVLNQD